MVKTPSTNGDNGRRDSQGRFAKGNAGGPGNPFARRVATLRSLIVDAVTEDDLRAVVSALVEQAKNGDVVAARELLNRLIGKPEDVVDPDRLELRERLLERELSQATPSELDRVLQGL